MRISHLFIAVAFLAASAFSQKYIQPKNDIVGIYANQTRLVYEEAIEKVGPDARLLILEEKGAFYKVKCESGQTGWIEKKLVVTLSKSKAFKFDQTEVIGYLDNPTPVYILDSDDPNANRIYFDRTFKNELRANVDQETVQRQSGTK